MILPLLQYAQNLDFFLIGQFVCGKDFVFNFKKKITIMRNCSSVHTNDRTVILISMDQNTVPIQVYCSIREHLVNRIKKKTTGASRVGEKLLNLPLTNIMFGGNFFLGHTRAVFRK